MQFIWRVSFYLIPTFTSWVLAVPVNPGHVPKWDFDHESWVPLWDVNSHVPAAPEEKIEEHTAHHDAWKPVTSLPHFEASKILPSPQAPQMPPWKTGVFENTDEAWKQPPKNNWNGKFQFHQDEHGDLALERTGSATVKGQDQLHNVGDQPTPAPWIRGPKFAGGDGAHSDVLDKVTTSNVPGKWVPLIYEPTWTKQHPDQLKDQQSDQQDHPIAGAAGLEQVDQVDEAQDEEMDVDTSGHRSENDDWDASRFNLESELEPEAESALKVKPYPEFETQPESTEAIEFPGHTPHEADTEAFESASSTGESRDGLREIWNEYFRAKAAVDKAATELGQGGIRLDDGHDNVHVEELWTPPEEELEQETDAQQQPDPQDEQHDNTQERERGGLGFSRGPWKSVSLEAVSEVDAQEESPGAMTSASQETRIPDQVDGDSVVWPNALKNEYDNPLITGEKKDSMEAKEREVWIGGHTESESWQREGGGRPDVQTAHDIDGLGFEDQIQPPSSENHHDGNLAMIDNEDAAVTDADIMVEATKTPAETPDATVDNLRCLTIVVVDTARLIQTAYPGIADEIQALTQQHRDVLADIVFRGALHRLNETVFGQVVRKIELVALQNLAGACMVDEDHDVSELAHAAAAIPAGWDEAASSSSSSSSSNAAMDDDEGGRGLRLGRNAFERRKSFLRRFLANPVPAMTYASLAARWDGVLHRFDQRAGPFMLLRMPH